MNRSGRQLATDYQNQQSLNRYSQFAAAADAADALTKYIGSGNDSYGAGTVYSALNKYNDNAISNAQLYGQLGNTSMTTTQKLDDIRVTGNIDNYDRYTNLAGTLTDVNATGAANNIKNAGTRHALTASAEAMKQQGLDTLDTLNKNKNKK